MRELRFIQVSNLPKGTEVGMIELRLWIRSGSLWFPCLELLSLIEHTFFYKTFVCKRSITWEEVQCCFLTARPVTSFAGLDIGLGLGNSIKHKTRQRWIYCVHVFRIQSQGKRADNRAEGTKGMGQFGGTEGKGNLKFWTVARNRGL